jgi:hypothetical protein
MEQAMRNMLWIVAAALAGLLAGSLTGCQAEKENIGWDYGKSYHTVFEAQKIAPAVVDDKPVDAMGGTRAVLAYDRLEKQAPEEKKQGSGGFEAFLQQK